MFKIAFKYIGFRYRQHRRKTSEKLVVETVYGPVRGVKRISCWDDPYYSFERIPYAKPPVGELRFAEPIPPEPWIEILDGTGEGPKPVQAEFGSKRIAGAEDCLFVNVFTKEVNPSVPKPVMVWIHGGGFVGGSTSRDLYSPDYFLSRDVVLVSVAYRLGLFGFLSMKDPSLKVPGNAGLKDQILGLKWVQQNISKFGGDPNNVTIFGESAGGASVHLLALTEKTKGLFHRVICMSGSAFAFWATPPVRNWSFRIAKDLGFKGEENELEILNFLRSVDSRKLAAAEDRAVSKEESYAGYIWCSYPVVEPYVTDQCVIPREPILMAHDSWSNSIPMIIGCTSREGIFFRNLTPPGIYEQWESDPTLMLPFDLKSDPNSERFKELGERLKKESFGTEKITDDNYINFISNKFFWHPAQRTVLSRQKYATAPTYLYVFDFDSPNYGLIKTLSSINLPGVSHGDDLGYLFLNMALPETQPDSLERKSPQPHEPWTTVLDGTSEASKPIQREYVIETVIGAEDCLFLNVFTKEINPSKLKPVFVWIYGGGFVRGSTSKDVYSPDYFLSKDVVFVSIAYRVGIFGFLSMKDPSLKIPGNAGLKDQILGLKWVQQNISRFGGDPNNVTIFGESAGGASVHFLGLTEKARGLFHQMICMSGSAFCNWALPPPKNWSLRIAKDLGYKGEDNDSAVLHFLRKADCKKIAISEANILTKQEMLEGYLWCSYPVVEPYKSDDCVLPEQPLILARDAWSNDIPVIVGGTSREGIFFANSKPSGAFKEWESNPSLILPFDLKTGRSGEECEELGRILKEYHFKDGKWTEDTFIDFLSYKLFWHGVHRMVLSRQKYAKAATYLYVFEFDSPKNALLKTLASVKTAGVSHGDDLAYLFLNFLTPETQAGSSERNKIEELIGLWFHFSRNGVPNCDGIGPCTWKPVQSIEKSHGCLRIGHELIFEQNPFANILQFWDDLYDEDKLF